MKTISVVVVDDHHLLAQAIGGLVEGFSNCKVLFLASNGEELIDRFKSPKNIPDVVLMDINMPIMNGVETTAYLKGHFPEVRVLALSIEDDDSTILKMIKAGARGYLLKDVKKEELEFALKETMKNDFYHTKNVTKVLLNTLNSNEEKVELKDREISFLKLVCTEMTYKRIAEEMCVSPKTIDGYRDALFEKLEIKNRTGLVIYAIKEGLFVLS